MLSLEKVSKRYPGEPQPALAEIGLTVAAGEFVAVLGRSGAGKSTLIRCINRLTEPDQGTISWGGEAVTGLKGDALRRMRGRLSMIFQQDDLLPGLDVLTNVMVGAFTAMPRWRALLFSFSREHRQQAESALQRVGLQGKMGRKPGELSGGQRQRVAIARALMQRPELLLGDEPVASLDPVTAVQILELIAELHRTEGLTVMLNLHDVGLARRYAGRIIGLSGGRIVFDGPSEELDEAAMQRIYPIEE